MHTSVHLMQSLCVLVACAFRKPSFHTPIKGNVLPLRDPNVNGPSFSLQGPSLIQQTLGGRLLLARLCARHLGAWMDKTETPACSGLTV